MSEIQAETQTTEAAQQPSEATPEVSAEAQKPADTSWVPRRISEITAARRAAEARAAELEAEVQRLRAAQVSAPSGDEQPIARQPAESVDQLARAYAERMRTQEREQESLNQGIARINEAGTKEFGDEFEKSVQNLQMAGVGGPDFLKVLTNIPKAEAVVTWLGKSENLNEAMRMATMDPVQMGIELTKLSSKAAKDLGKQISKAPEPIKPLDTNASGGDGAEPDPKDTARWMEWRNKTRKSRR